jgi:hypothetical protein
MAKLNNLSAPEQRYNTFVTASDEVDPAVNLRIFGLTSGYYDVAEYALNFPEKNYSGSSFSRTSSR